MMKKLFVVACLSVSISFQAPAVSISAQLGGKQTNQSKTSDKAAKVIVACACDDLFPIVQAILVQGKPEVKELVKLQLNAMGLNKDQLSEVKRMIKEAEPLLLEGVRLAAQLVNKHGKDLRSMLQRAVARNIAAGDMYNDEDEALVQEGHAIRDLILDDAQLDQFIEKLAAFDEKYTSSLISMMGNQRNDAQTHEDMIEQSQESLQNLLAKALGNKDSVRLQSSIVPIITGIKTQMDALLLLQACLNELETKLPHVVVSTEKFAEFAVPFLATVITESIDETVNSMPA